MKASIISASLALTLASAHPSIISSRDAVNTSDTGAFIAAGPDDLRGPCPMMNTLANHGFLPRDGGNITRENAVYALTEGLNFNASVANIMWEQAIIANPEPNATFFTLDNLNRHNVLEHDASISRSDAAFGNNHVFNQTIFDTTTAYWTEETLDANQLANGKIFRQLQSKAFNPNYTFTSTTEAFSLGEMSAPILIFGDIPAGTVNKSLVLFFFENEKLPTELGWTKQATPINLDQVGTTSQLISNATSLITASQPAAAQAVLSRRNLVRDLHSGGLII
ncbi:related to chloroperoxidase [Phialocephala subalpina]|uniref:Related to chloroperoxidase n=1 Tax=Phialocephala subalpina TaxID=576137 RepID=A0A1L7WTY8_9HELO|nr:related to chloroperoxidase [Phialocephala subalpina]